MIVKDILTLDDAINYFWEKFASTIDDDEANAYGGIYVWLVALRDYKKSEQAMLQLNIPKEVLGLDSDKQYCPNCHESSMLYNQFKIENQRCGNCGQLLDWREDDE